MTNSHFIDGEWLEGSGVGFKSVDPGNGEVIWEGTEAGEDEINKAVESARKAFKTWSVRPIEERFSYVEKFKNLLEENKDELASLISREVGKPKWEALTEVGAMIGKANLSKEAFEKRSAETTKDLGTAKSITRYKPHGVVAVFGPYNFPGHLANGHIIPALLAGNTVVFKQSEMVPAVGEKTIELWEKAGLPRGVLNLLQGGKATGIPLGKHENLKGLFFTGSSETGLILHKQFADHPEKILALEMGGNNPLVVLDVQDKKAAAYTTIQSAFLTSGQRCTCARRLIVPNGATGDEFLQELVTMIPKIKVGHYTETPEPFMGPVISAETAKHVLTSYQNLIEYGGKPLVEMELLKEDTGLLSPALIDVTEIENRKDKEIFGPLLQVIRVDDFDAAIEEANDTAYGLSAGLLSDSREDYDRFYQSVNAGIINWNRQTTGASGAAPFGGIGISGNHRPSAYFAVDYCSYPIATIEESELTQPEKLLPGIEL